MNEPKNCYADTCEFKKPHIHIITANGSYVRYIDTTRLCPHGKQESHCLTCLNKPKKKEYGDNDFN